jgi:pimeloyl-ACP methyl ester carboxylesterase
LRLHYADWGNASAPPLILLHERLDHCRTWDWVAEELGRDFHIVAPDLRGHGDSAPSPSGAYTVSAYLCDLTQLIRQLGRSRVSLVGHGLGGEIALIYAGVFPGMVGKLVAIESLGDSPAFEAERAELPIAARLASWLAERYEVAGRIPKRYRTIEEAYARMRWQNGHLSPRQAKHLTDHGVNRNEDGTFSWRFDNYVRVAGSTVDLSADERHELWSKINCPVLLMLGDESGASNPVDDGRIGHFAAARVEVIQNAGHWIYHDRLDAFVGALRAFL